MDAGLPASRATLALGATPFLFQARSALAPLEFRAQITYGDAVAAQQDPHVIEDITGFIDNVLASRDGLRAGRGRFEQSR